MSPLLAVLLAASIDGEAALRHASALAALGPHPWGSPRSQAAAEYVASQLRDAGLTEVRLQGFESQGIHGTNVIGVLRAPGPEIVVVGAHHDTAPDAPGALAGSSRPCRMAECSSSVASAGLVPRSSASRARVRA